LHILGEARHGVWVLLDVGRLQGFGELPVVSLTLDRDLLLELGPLFLLLPGFGLALVGRQLSLGLDQLAFVSVAIFLAAMIPASVGGIILVLEAPVASAIAILFLGEILTTTQFIGMGLILVAIVLPTVWKGRA
jgi:threonine/homoserine efflux transporter RhtA